MVGRDGSNSFSHRSSVTGVSHPSRAPGTQQRTKVPMIPPAQQQQPQQQSPPPPSDYGAQQQYAASGYGAQSSVAGAQPSFFMTGGGFAAASPSQYGGGGSYAIPQAPPAHLPPLNPPPQEAPSPQQQQQQILTPTNQQPAHGRRGFAQGLVAHSMGGVALDDGEGSPGRRGRRKDPLPDFHELEVLDHSRRQGRQHVERMPVLVDHPVAGEYHQHTIGEYKRMLKEYQRQRFGGLGAEDNEQKQQEREKRRKMHEYGKQVNAVNFAVLDQLMGDSWHNRPIEKKLDTDAQLALIKRQRAKMYADAVKPPVVSARRGSPPKSKTPQPTMSESARALETVETLEEKHRRDQEAIRRIKAQLNML